MESIFSNINIKINEKLYNKNPYSSELGIKILQNSILLIDEIGFESFTFKKLGERIDSNESSIYRYFENKHKLLIYLCIWYWSWVEYELIFATQNIDDPLTKCTNAIYVLSMKKHIFSIALNVDEKSFHRIIISEFMKIFLTKEVDDENKEGFFVVYKRVCLRLENIIDELIPNYAFSKSLASSIIQGILHQQFLSEHLTTITNCKENISVTNFYIDLINQITTKK